MKNRIYIISLVLISMLYACKDEYEAPMFLADASWLISETNNVRINEGIYVINEGHWISFADLSQGTLSHTWTISDGTQFMKTGFGKDEEDYSQFVIPNSGNVSEDAKIHVYFGDAGERTVRLYNTFPDSVAFTSTGTYKNNGELEYPGDTLVSHKVGDEWVIDTTFVVDVYADVQPEFYIYKALESGDSLVYHLKAGEIYTIEDSLNFAQVNLEMGQELRVIDSTKFDRPDGREWAIDHGLKNPTKTEALDTLISFVSLDTLVMGSVKVFRIAPENIVSTLIPVIVNVGPSSEPFQIDGEIYQTSNPSDNTVSLQLTGAIAEIDDNAKDAFKVIVNNSLAGVSDLEIEAKSVAVDRDNATMLLLKMQDAIYGSDDITVEYTPTGNSDEIKRQDYKVLESFTAQSVITFGTEMLTNRDEVGFEIEKGGTNGWKSAYANNWWSGNNNSEDGGVTTYFARVESDVFPNVIGNASMRYKGEITTLNLDYTNISSEDIPIGTYRVGLNIYLDESSSIVKLKTKSVTQNHDLVEFDLTNVEKGKWVYLAKDVFLPSGLNSEHANGIRFRISIDSDCGSGNQLFYLDDISFKSLEARN